MADNKQVPQAGNYPDSEGEFGGQVDNDDAYAATLVINEDQHTSTLVIDEDPHTSTLVINEGPHNSTMANDEGPHNSTMGNDEDPFSSTMVIDESAKNEPAADRQVQIGSVLRDRFVLTEEVAGGSMGTVYKALDRRLAETDSENHWVAIKVLSPQLSHNADALRALQQEAVKTRCLSHPNIVRFIDLDREEDLYFMVMEWLDGRSLTEILNDGANRVLDLDTSLDIIRHIAAALSYAHQRGVIHADVKPGNIMITPSGEAKLLDFGVARIRQKQSGTQQQFDPRDLRAATPAYSSMQVLTGEDPVAADDVFSLACLAYRLIAGFRAFGPRNAAEAAEAGMEPQPIDCLSKPQWQAMRKALAFSRVSRFATPTEFVDALGKPKERIAPVEKPVEKPVIVDGPAIDPADIRFPEVEPGGNKAWLLIVLVLIIGSAAAFFFQEDLKAFILSISETTEAPVTEETTTPADIPAKEPSLSLPNDSLPDKPLSNDWLPEEPPAPAVVDATDLTQGETKLPEDAKTAGDPRGEATSSNAIEALATDMPNDEQEISPAASEVAGNVAQGAFLKSDQLAVLVEKKPKGKPVFDFSTLPPANLIVSLAGPGEFPGVSSLILREDTGPTIVDFVRESHLAEKLIARLTEVGFDGNESPMETGQYWISNGGLIQFPPGQHRARVSIMMASDPLRESDRQVTLSVLDSDYGDVEFATIKLTLQDDDQRAFEASLPANTVAFSASQVSVRERDAAVQVEIIRYKPDARSLDVDYQVRDVTATAGEDYIVPGSKTVSFAPYQNSARILIPLLQDAIVESDEAFMLELVGVESGADANTYRRIAVMIRDDDS